jgi:hypothetical protein
MNCCGQVKLTGAVATKTEIPAFAGMTEWDLAGFVPAPPAAFPRKRESPFQYSYSARFTEMPRAGERWDGSTIVPEVS